MTLHVGDCVAVMRTFDADSFDAVVTDPPYGLEFMGQEWDRPWRGDTRQRGDVDFTAADDSEPFGRVRHGGTPSYGADVNASRALQAWHEAWATEAFRVLKPGGHLVAFGGTRTYHRLACAVEDAGFEIRDSLHWMYGNGFPKSLNVPKAIDKEQGDVGTFGDPKSAAHAEWIKRGRMRGEVTQGHEGYQRPWMQDEEAVDQAAREYVGGSDASRAWEGWGTALKPAHEPIVLARKPLAGTVARNVLQHGTGALNIDASRVGTDRVSTHDRGANQAFPKRPGETTVEESGRTRRQDQVDTETVRSGRWPSNVVFSHDVGCVKVGTRQVKTGIAANENRPEHGYDASSYKIAYAGRWGYADEDRMETVDAWECVESCPVRALDQQSGDTTSRAGLPRGFAMPGDGWGDDPTGAEYADAGGASRFFPSLPVDELAFPFMYVAKAGRAEREAGLKDFVARPRGADDGAAVDNSKKGPTNALRPDQATQARNVHPTVKPVELMRWLIRLVTPKGGTVLDPFLGSGTTAVAAIIDNVAWVGIERNEEYVAIAQARVAWAEDYVIGQLIPLFE